MASGSRRTEVVGRNTLELLRLTAWMPDGHGQCVFQPGELDIHDWVAENCHDCCFYFDDYEEESPGALAGIVDGDDNPAISVTYQSRCPCKRSGFSEVAFPCPAGLDEPEDSDLSGYDGPLPPMAYAIDCIPATGGVYESSAWMQAVAPDGPYVSSTFRAVNTFDTDRVCWGAENSTPDSLPQVVATYCDATCNEDLIDADTYSFNCRRVRSDSTLGTPFGSLIDPGYDAALLVSIKDHLSAYLMLRGAGFQACSGVIAVGLRHHVHQDGSDGVQIRGFLSQPDLLGRCWFCVSSPIDEDDPKPFLGHLLGQIPNPNSPCTLTALSSSAPVALAAS